MFLADLLATMTSSQYRHRQAPNDSVGAHVRHLLEHYDQLLEHASGPIDYDRRPRNQRLETSLEAASETIQRIRRSLPDQQDRPVQIRYSPQAVCDESTINVESSIARELLFLVSHTIHHMAMIALFARQAGLAVPSDFGVTPSTLHHRESLGDCVIEPS